MLRACVNLFWLIFLADGVLSFAEERLSPDGNIFWLGLVRSLLAFLTLLASLGAAGMVVFSPRVPKRVLLPMILFLWWAGPGMAFPLGYGKQPDLMLWLSAVQIFLGTMLWFLFGLGKEKRLCPFALHEGPVFSWKHTLLTGPVVGAAAAVFAFLSVFSALSSEIESRSGGYVRIRMDGVYLLERQFKSGQNEVRLTGMIHIAQGDFYSGVLPKADPAIPAVVLVEGVTDHQGLLSKGALKYSRVARLFKVTSQDESEFTEHVTSGLRKEKIREEESPPAPEEQKSNLEEIDFKHADVDVETFHPQTIAFILTVMSILQSEDLQQFFKTLSDPDSPLNDEGAQTQVMQDILHSRNERLVSEIQSSLHDYRRVIVPWGALHLPEIELWLRKHDFVQSGEVERKALSFW